MAEHQGELLARPEPNRWTCQFRIPGEPVPKARPRARIVTPTGKKPFVSIYTPSETREFEEQVAKLAAYAMMGHPPMQHGVELQVTVYLQVPDTWARWKRDASLERMIVPTVKPDLSNVVKSIEDGMNKVVYLDDSQIVSSDVVKLFHDGPSFTLVRVRESGRIASTVSSRADYEAARG